MKIDVSCAPDQIKETLEGNVYAVKGGKQQREKFWLCVADDIGDQMIHFLKIDANGLICGVGSYGRHCFDENRIWGRPPIGKLRDNLPNFVIDWFPSCR